MAAMSCEMIMCIVHSGCAADVMLAARDAGVRGGTVIRGHGTAAKEAEEFFHITVQPEKEIVIMLVPSEIKDSVLHALYRSVGLDTRGQGIAFAIPVNDAVGLS